MTAPRQVLPGKTYLITRRCAQREFLLRPSEFTTQLFLYVLAVAARRFGIGIHGFCVLSNHFHLVVTDFAGILPKFMQQLCGFVARAMNHHLGRSESFWSPGSYSAVELATPDAIVEKMAYVLTNPVAAGLVRAGRSWPGAWSDLWSAETSVLVQRPSFFRKKGPMAAQAELHLVAPPGFESMQEFRDRVAASVTELEKGAIQAVDSSGRTFLGVAGVLRQPTTGRPATHATRGGLRPKVATRDRWKRVEVLARWRSFVDDHREALVAFRSGKRDVIFPAGTYWMRVVHGVACEPYSAAA